jgi:hypothetical protein
MIDVPSIEKTYRRILKSRRSMVYKTEMANQLFQNINGFYGALKDGSAKAQFRADYVRLAEMRFGLPTGNSATTNNRLADLMIEHARNLNTVEVATEKLNRELGDF